MDKMDKIRKLSDFTDTGGTYEKLSDFVGKKVIITNQMEKIGKFGGFRVLILQNGAQVMTSSEAIMRVVDEAEKKGAFPFEAKVVSIHSKKRKGKSYIAFAE